MLPKLRQNWQFFRKKWVNPNFRLAGLETTPRSFNDVPEDKMVVTPEELPQLQGKMMAVQKLGSSINQLQQKGDYTGAMAQYRCPLPQSTVTTLLPSQFQAACLRVLSPPHQFFTIAR